MNFLAIIVAVILIAIFWRLFAGLAAAAIVVLLGILAADWAWPHVEDYFKRGNWTLTFDVIGEDPTVFTKLASRKECERRKDDILKATRAAHGDQDMWKIAMRCE